jgi:hypothetical protein
MCADRFTPAAFAARCGATGGANEYGLMSAAGAATFAPAISAATSAFSAVTGSMPAATGFIPIARTPDVPSERSSDPATSVLPTPVSVPVTKMPRVMARYPRGRRSRRTMACPSAVRFGAAFHACP